MVMKNHHQINIRKTTVSELENLKHTGQSYDGVIQELIKNRKPLEQVC